MSKDKRLAVLLVGFGGPESIDQVPAFVESVLGRRPPDHVLVSVTDRYRAIGGGSPLPGTTRRQAALVGEELTRRGIKADVNVGMLHARPTIEEAADRMVAAGVKDLSVISLAPYRCEVSTDAYEAAVEKALNGKGPRLHFASDWNLATGYVRALADMLAQSLEEAPADTPVIFAAHSLPERMIEQGDPYADQLLATAGTVAAEIGLRDWHLAYQSVSAAAREPWLGPSVDQVMERLAADGANSVLIDPIGFISDHVETLYDNDIEHRAHAKALGLDFYRCRCLNHHSGLIDALADLVETTADHD
ncbi:MAG: ferrochelatase [Acidimicrobiia bacterium]|nr:ferrochelatase [Acidimicrobiia bacterium]MDQ3501176.1 ferrochelatase [Actinomycetota bacterium]